MGQCTRLQLPRLLRQLCTPQARRALLPGGLLLQQRLQKRPAQRQCS